MLNQYLTLTRPLACIDCETTGLDPKIDRIIQAGVTMHYPDKDPVRWSSLINPGIPILNDQHGLTDADIEACYKCRLPKENHPSPDCEDHLECPGFVDFAPRLLTHFTDVDICAYNGNFDVDFFLEEFSRAGHKWVFTGYLIDPLQIYKVRRGHTLVNCYLEFGSEDGSPLPPDTVIEDAHDAAADVRMMEISLRGQLLRYPELPRTVKELSEACFPNFIDKGGKFKWTESGEPILTFGKFRGQSIKDPQVRGYLKWMTLSNFSADVKEICEDALLGVFPTRP